MSDRKYTRHNWGVLWEFSKGGKVDLPLPDLHNLLLTLALIILVKVLVGVLAQKRFLELRAISSKV